MATTVAPPPSSAEKATDLLQKLSLDSQTKTTTKAPETTKKPSVTPIQTSERTGTPQLPEYFDPYYGYPSTAYYYGGYDGSYGDWEGYLNPDGTGVYGDNASLMYGYGYTAYGPYSPAGPTVGHDGQLYGPQQYQYPTPYYQSPTPTTGSQVPKQTSTNQTAASNQAPATQGEVSTSVAADQAALPAESANGNAKGTSNGNVSKPFKPSQTNVSSNSNGSNGKGAFTGVTPASGHQDPRFYYDGMSSPVPWVDGQFFSNGQYRPATSGSLSSTPLRSNNIQQGRNQNIQPLPNFMGLQSLRPTSGMGPNSGYVNRMYPNSRMYGQYGNSARTGAGFGYGYDSRTNGRGWMAFDGKYKPKGRGNGFFGYGNENMDGFNELNRGPRARGFKNQKGIAPSNSAVKGQDNSSNVSNEEKDSSTVTPDREQYNKEDFPEKYTDAKFFIIKSYSEDDVHKSIKYSVWASTPNGNKKLDTAYQEAQEKSGGCPVFLLFSVNTSGQFIGLAEMVGSVDFNKNLEYWQQDKWTGCFPLKWHIVKDVPNSLLKHITLENNDNKPVTNSRDTQEVKFEQGIQMLKIFKDHSSKTCILDDFGFYEARQKTVQEKKAKQQQSQKQVWEGKTTDVVASDVKEKEAPNGKLASPNSLEVVALPKESVDSLANGDSKQLKEKETNGEAKDASKGAKAVVTDKRAVSNGDAAISNGIKAITKGDVSLPNGVAPVANGVPAVSNGVADGCS